MGVGNAALSAQFLRTFNATIHNFGRTHPERRPRYCSFLTKIASLDFSYDDNYFESQTIELAARLIRPRVDCISPVMAALPHTDAVKARVADTREDCQLEGYPLCNRIVQPPPATALHL